MALKVGDLTFNVNANTASLTTGLAGAKSQLSSFAMAGFAGGIGGGLVGGFEKLASAALSAGRSMVDLAANLESARASFAVLTGSAGGAETMLNNLRAFSAQSGMDFGSLQDGAKVMMSFGVEVDRIMPALKAISTVTGGNADRTKMLTLAFAQMAAAGRLMGQDLLQMVNAGFNPLQQISQKTGVSMIDLKKRMEDGGISATEVMQAFQDATEKGGRFFGMLEKQGSTFSRQWSQLKSQVSVLGTELGALMLPPLTEMVRLLNSALKTFDRIRGAAKNTAQETGKLVTLLDKIAADEKKRGDEDAKRTKDADKLGEKTKDRAEDITKGLMTPLEQAAAKFVELRDLMGKGLISPETFKRGTDKLLEDLDKATELKKKLEEKSPDMGAIDLRTAGGQAAASQLRNERKIENFWKENNDAAKRLEELTRKLLDEVKNSKPITVKKVAAL